MTKIAVLSYSYSNNFGDEIQSIATKNCLPHVDTEISRENLKNFTSTEKHILIMNGWFSHNPQGEFPPSLDIIPVYYSFHITPEQSAFFTSPECIEHFKRWQPIGCRDRGTMELLINCGVDAFYSKCLTLTLPKRQAITNGQVFIVDAIDCTIPDNLKKDSVVLTHGHDNDSLPTKEKFNRAQNLLNRYRDEASLVITSRLHCALPCQAMGIPVVFIVPVSLYGEQRIEIYSDIGGMIYYNPHSFSKLFNLILESRYTKLFKYLPQNAHKSLKSNWEHVDEIDIESTAFQIRSGLIEKLTTITNLSD